MLERMEGGVGGTQEELFIQEKGESLLRDAVQLPGGVTAVLVQDPQRHHTCVLEKAVVQIPYLSPGMRH